MEQFPKAVGAMLALILACLASWSSPVLALYMYDAQPASGYVAATDEDSAYYNTAANKKYYTNPKNMKLVNERAVDSYFRILRATPQTLPPPAVKARGPPTEVRVAVTTEAPNLHHQQNRPIEDVALRSDPRNDNYSEKEKALPGVNQFMKRDDEEINKQKIKDFRTHSFFDKNTIMAKGNKKTNRRPHRAQNFHHIMYLSQVRDKVLHKANLKGDSARAKPRSRTDAFQTVSDKHPHRSKDNKKRNTIKDRESILETGGETDSEIYSPNYRHENVEDRIQQTWGHSPPAKLESYVAEKEVEPPYALFYRTSYEPEMEHPAPLDTHDGGSYYRGSYLDLNTGRKHFSAIL